MCSGTPTTTPITGGRRTIDRRHVASVYYIYDLPFWRDQSTLMRNLLGGWQVSGATFFRTGTPFAVLRTNDIAGVGDGGFLQPVQPGGRRQRGREQGVLDRPSATATTGSTRRPSPTRRAGTFGNAPRNLLRNPGEQQWDIALFKNFNLGGTRRAQFRAEFFNFPNHPNWGGTGNQSGVQTDALQGQGYADPGNAAFGRVIAKNGERTAQLSLRFLF